MHAKRENRGVLHAHHWQYRLPSTLLGCRRLHSDAEFACSVQDKVRIAHNLVCEKLKTMLALPAASTSCQSYHICPQRARINHWLVQLIPCGAYSVSMSMSQSATGPGVIRVQAASGRSAHIVSPTPQPAASHCTSPPSR